MNAYELARKRYESIGIDTEAALQTLAGVSIAMHCWQGDDVGGFDQDGPLTGGIQATGSYPGKARNPQELMADMDKALSLVPGKHKINLHACYAIFNAGEYADRDALAPAHFAAWADFAKARGLGIDFNPTFFSHPKAAEFTLSHPDEAIRNFWIAHGQACIRISEYFAAELGQQCVMNIWIPDGYKDMPADRLAPRARFADSLDKMLAIDYDKEKVLVCLESKVFGIGLESYTVGSSEFCLQYAATRGILSLMDTGHYHPTEVVSDKISSLLLFNETIALHISRPVRWDSDHVVRFDDETREIAKEIVAHNALGRTLLALDFFDASINRVAAWVLGMRNFQKALLAALLTPHAALKEMQHKGRLTELLVMQEEWKLYPVGDVWNRFCEMHGVPQKEDWFASVTEYEAAVLTARQ